MIEAAKACNCTVFEFLEKPNFEQTYWINAAQVYNIYKIKTTPSRL